MRLLPLLSVSILSVSTLSANPFSFIAEKREQAQQTRAIVQAKNILAALYHYASDHEGEFPTGNTAEECFNKLIKGGYVEDESIFWIERSAKFNVVASTKPNNDGVLTAAENSWGYVSGFTTTSRTRFPIIFDSSTKPGEFNTEMWRKSKALVCRLDASVRMLPITPNKPLKKTDKTTLGTIQIKRGENFINLFENLPDGAVILTPQTVKKKPTIAPKKPQSASSKE